MGRCFRSLDKGTDLNGRFQAFQAFQGFQRLEFSCLPDFRVIPSIEILRRGARVRELEAQHGTEATVAALRAGADGLRARIAAGEAIGHAAESIEAFAQAALRNLA